MGISTRKAGDELLSNQHAHKHCVTVLGECIAFNSASQAAAAYAALSKGREAKYIYSGPDGISRQLNQEDDALRLSVDVKHMLLCDEDSVGREYQVFTCDHNLVTNSDACGISPCHTQANNRETGEYPPAGWRLSEKPVEDGTRTEMLVSCPECVQRTADGMDIEVEDLTEVDMWGQRGFELEVMERAERSNS